MFTDRKRTDLLVNVGTFRNVIFYTTDPSPRATYWHSRVRNNVDRKKNFDLSSYGLEVPYDIRHPRTHTHTHTYIHTHLVGMESMVKVDMKVGFGNLICMGSMIMVETEVGWAI